MAINLFFVSTGFEYADARKVSTYDNGDIYIGL